MEGAPAVVFASLASVLSLSLGSFSLAGLEPGLADSDLLLDFRGPESHENCQTFLNKNFQKFCYLIIFLGALDIKNLSGVLFGVVMIEVLRGKKFFAPSLPCSMI